MNYHALVANAGNGTVSAFAFDGRQLHRLAVSPVGPGCSTFAVDPGLALVHVAVKGEQPAVVSCALDADSGVLTPRWTTPAESSLTYLSVSPDGRWLAGVSYGGGFGTVRPLDERGRAGDPTARVEFANLHSVAFSPDSRFVYFVSLGDDVIAGYQIAEAGELSPLPSTPAPAGSGPRHLVLTGAGDGLYVLTEFSGQVLAFARDVDTGVLTSIGAADGYAPGRGLRHSEFGADPRKHNFIWGADLVLARDERFVVCSERNASTLAVLPIADDRTVGAATQFAGTQEQPRGIGVSPDGRFVIATGERATRISAYEMADADGALTEVDSAETGPGANWVRFC